MADGWLKSNELKIIKGVGRVAGDTNSAEQDPVVFNLLDGICTLIDWSPNIASLKNGGVWIDSPLTDGRNLLSAPAANVIEKISISLSSAGYLNVSKAFDLLNKMVSDSHDFWQTESQIEPVYLHWWANCAPGPQYALIYDIQLAVEYRDSTQPTIDIELTIEREPYWRGIPPGANPKLWTFYSRGENFGTAKTASNLNLGNTDALASATLQNRTEWETTGFSSFISKNFIDIPASAIPGDAPALVQIEASTTHTTNTRYAKNVFIWRSTKPTSIKDNNGALIYQANIFNVGDANTNGPTKTIDATNGVISNGSNVTRYIATYTVLASASPNDLIAFPGTTGFPNAALNLNRGNYAVFLRCKQLTGASGDVQARFRLTAYGSGVTSGLLYTSAYVNMPFFAAAYAFGLLYLGTITLPVAGRSLSGVDGLGLSSPAKSGFTSDYGINIDLKNNAAANRNVQFLDLILFAYDEPGIQLNNPSFTNLGTIVNDYDNTGYFQHGRPGDYSKQSNDIAFPEILGQSLNLIPRVNNRLYFLFTSADTTTNPTEIYSDPNPTGTALTGITARVNIVPRWSGIRDV